MEVPTLCILTLLMTVRSRRPDARSLCSSIFVERRWRGLTSRCIERFGHTWNLRGQAHVVRRGRQSLRLDDGLTHSGLRGLRKVRRVQPKWTSSTCCRLLWLAAARKHVEPGSFSRWLMLLCRLNRRRHIECLWWCSSRSSECGLQSSHIVHHARWRPVHGI